MRYMLDTDICIDLLRGKAAAVYKRLRSLEPEEVGISAITLAELRYGAARSARRAHHEVLLVAFCAPLALAPFDARAAEAYGSIRAALEAAGTPIGPLDTLIAAHAVSLGATLITANVREFRRVPGLVVADWLRPWRGRLNRISSRLPKTRSCTRGHQSCNHRGRVHYLRPAVGAGHPGRAGAGRHDIRPL